MDSAVAITLEAYPTMFRPLEDVSPEGVLCWLEDAIQKMNAEWGEYSPVYGYMARRDLSIAEREVWRNLHRLCWEYEFHTEGNIG